MSDRMIAPEVRQRRLAAIRQAIELGHVGGNEDTEWLLEDVERLEAQFTARAQEIAQVQAENERLREFIDVLDDRSLADLVQARREGAYAGDVHDAPDDCETFVPITRGELRRHRRAEAALVSHAPQPEQE